MEEQFYFFSFQNKAEQYVICLQISIKYINNSYFVNKIMIKDEKLSF